MYDFSGIVFRIWGVCGIIFAVGVLCIVFGKPWEKGCRTKEFRTGVIVTIFALGLALLYLSRILFPNVLSHSGEYLESHRNSRTAPPLPVTYEYIFENDGEVNRRFYLDVFSKKSICPDGFKEGCSYRVYYDSITNVIVGVEELG